MRLHERSPVSRVREIRMHGLKGVLLKCPLSSGKESRFYQ
jgi:hypothetical protein